MGWHYGAQPGFLQYEAIQWMLLCIPCYGDPQYEHNLKGIESTNLSWAAPGS